MAMYKHQFEVIADAVRHHDFRTDEERKAMALRFVEAFRSENTRFDPARFLAACGVGAGQ
jgi:hypothetical protein